MANIFLHESYFKIFHINGPKRTNLGLGVTLVSVVFRFTENMYIVQFCLKTSNFLNCNYLKTKEDINGFVLGKRKANSLRI